MAEEKTDISEIPETVVARATPAAADARQSAAPRDEFDSSGWLVPVVCKDCNKGFEVPYRHFQVGVVFHCPHCHGSFVPKLPMYRAVRDAFESFYSKRQRDHAAALARDGTETALRSREAAELAAFRKVLDQLAQAMRPAGKMVKRKGLAAMFT